MHPYIAYLILSNPANHGAPRPDECHFCLREFIALIWQRCRALPTGPA